MWRDRQRCPRRAPEEAKDLAARHRESQPVPRYRDAKSSLQRYQFGLSVFAAH
jgi:hypothetical protein